MKAGDDPRRKHKRLNLTMACKGCGVGFEGHGNSRYCGACKRGSVKRLVGKDGVEVAYGAWKALVKRSGVEKRNLGLSEFRLLVGKCAYCGGLGLGLVRMDLSGRWSPSNVVCACGVCGRAKAGLSHSEFSSLVLRIAENLTKED